MCVLLISPLCEHPRYPLYFPSENLGIGYIASYLRSKNIQVDIFDANMLEIPFNKILEHIDITKYALVGIASSSFLLIKEALRVAEAIKKRNNNIHITIGGHFVTFSHKEVLTSSPYVDSIVRGEGEETVYELIECILKQQSLRGIPGLTLREGSLIITNVGRNLISDLDSLPWPARDTLPFLSSLGHSWPTQITTSRGCYANCSFCDIRAFSGTLWRGRNELDIIDEIEFLQKTYGSKVFRFTDDEFIGPKPHGPKRAMRMAEEIIKRDIKVELMIDARAHMVEKDLFKLLAQAGVNDCLIGIESGVDRILKLYNKGISVSTNSRAINILHELDIKLNLAFIMFDPRMTFEELKLNYLFLKDHEIITSDSLKSWIWPLDGTPLRKTLIEQGYVEIVGFDEFSYNFTDIKVGKIFSEINVCSQIAFPVEREFYKIKKFSLLPKEDITYLSSLNLKLWTTVFEELLKNPDGSVVDFMKINVNEILNKIAVKLNKTPST